MADPRLTYDYTDIKPVLMSFAADGTITYDRTLAKGSAQAGLAVTMSASKQVSTAADAEGIAGVIDHVEADGTVVVQVGGVATMKGGTGATLTPGSKIVGDLGGGGAAEGYIRSVAAATLAEVAVARGTILDASDATAVKVWLG